MTEKSYGFYNLQQYKITEGVQICKYEHQGESIKIILEDGTYFICGINTIIFDINNNQLEAGFLEENKTRLSDGSLVISKENVGIMELTDIDVSNEENSFYIIFDGHEIKVHNMPSISVDIQPPKETLQDTTQVGNVIYDTTWYYTSPAYNNTLVKTEDDKLSNVHSISVNIENTGSLSFLFPTTIKQIRRGYVYTENGAKIWWYRPEGIKNLLNVAILKHSPYTMVLATNSSYRSKSTLIKVNPTGLEELGTILNIQIATSWDIYDGRIIIAGKTTDNRFAIWECNNEDYQFLMLWKDDEEAPDTHNAGITAHEVQNNDEGVKYSTTNVMFPYGSTKSKLVQFVYVYETDEFYSNVTVINAYAYLQHQGQYSCFYGAGGILQNQIRYNNVTTNPESTYETRTFTGDLQYINRAFESGRQNWLLSVTASATGRVYVSTDYGYNYTMIAGGDNAYRILNKAPFGGYWGVGVNAQNYWMALWRVSNTQYNISKVTFPTSSISTLRINIPGDAILLLNSSTVYLYNQASLMNGQAQTVTTTTLTDENGNPFVATQACYNYDKTESVKLYHQAHTFYLNADGMLLSESPDTYGGWYKESIYLGDAVLMKRNNDDILYG